MGGFLGIGGSSAKTDRKYQLMGMEGLKNIFNWALPAGKAELGAGQGTLQQALESLGLSGDYWKKVLGSRTEAMQAAAPAISAAEEMGDAARRQQSEMGTARGGGVAAAGAEAESERRKQIDTIIAGGRPEAAKEIAKVGVAEAGIGSTELNAALNLLGLGEASTEALTGIAMKSRGQSFAINQATQEQIGQFVGNLLLGF